MTANMIVIFLFYNPFPKLRFVSRALRLSGMANPCKTPEMDYRFSDRLKDFHLIVAKLELPELKTVISSIQNLSNDFKNQ